MFEDIAVNICRGTVRNTTCQVIRRTAVLRCLAATGLFAACSGDSALSPLAVDGASAVMVAQTRHLLQLIVKDPIGDNTGPIDVTEMVMRFDTLSGDYQIDVFASASAPFAGDFRINVNLFNAGRALFFQDAFNDFSLGSGVQRLRLTGNSQALRTWAVGDAVYTNSLAGTPNPPGASLYRTAVTSVPFTYLTNEDYVAFANAATPAVVTAAPLRPRP
jgi:hypothetical protein